MTDRVNTIQKNELNKHKLHQNVISSLSNKLGIPDLRARNITIRDERNWRINEKQIDYCWLINISRSLIGSCWLFSIKFNECIFRDIKNETELIQGIFTIDKQIEIDKFYSTVQAKNFKDKIKELTSYDMFDVNSGITLDGTGYEYLIFSVNAEIKMSLNNPNSKNWKVWEAEVWSIGKELAQKSKINNLTEIFV
ncbi:hypothetical protein [Aureispira anguillae]|uniref:Uncharacterized protein n=1 Tax=Aureispira anguillae TaxID=2864201 RepID=A0A915YEA3_9BACT|nr:hypothetical protein [Aureispira anguillae]BDS11467.1 hypothetical protein AsAng_0021810 [Aureispira anguillae]